MKIAINSEETQIVSGLENLYYGIWISDRKVIIMVAQKPVFNKETSKWSNCLMVSNEEFVVLTSSGWSQVNFTPFKGNITITAP